MNIVWVELLELQDFFKIEFAIKKKNKAKLPEDEEDFEESDFDSDEFDLDADDADDADFDGDSEGVDLDNEY
ncbi:hypothetical protein J4216_01210 [Candidatus Woesearchaeota archaeon]|nr:hypothetical protein [Candidatus Woesearchaeota archaeon]